MLICVPLRTINRIRHLSYFAHTPDSTITHLRLKDNEKAKALLQQALIANPQDKASLHMFNALCQNKTDVVASSEYALHLFNNYALYYDTHLRDYLKYSLPQQLIKLCDQLDLHCIAKALDLGCGTGLAGQAIHDYCSSLTGVDISPKMLMKAEEKGIYDTLIEEDVILFLQNSTSSYDVIVAMDVLPYFAELGTLLNLVQQHLNPHGYFLFSTEISDSPPWQLQTNARFSHHEHYLQQLASEYGFDCKWQEVITARQQEGQPVQEFLIAWQKLS